MDIPSSTDLVEKWLPNARRGVDLTEDMSSLKPFQLESARQYIDTMLLRLQNSLNVLNARNDASIRHGKRNPEFRTEKLRLEREIESFTNLRPQINRVLEDSA